MHRLTVAIDGRRLQDVVPGGVARYIAGILPTISAEPDLEVVLVGDGRRRPPDVDVPFVGLKWLPGAPELAWLDGALRPWLNRSGMLFHGTFNQVPLLWSGSCVVTVHDLSFEMHRRDFSRSKAFAWRRYARHAVKVATELLTDSDFIRQQIVERFGTPHRKITVAPLAQSVDLAALAGRATLTLPSPYVVALGGAPRRNLPVAIEAWRAARARVSKLNMVVVGTEKPVPEPGLVYLGAADDATWAAAMAGAEALVYPTEYEGYGVPAHEALVLGTPVVCGRVSSLPEILGDVGVWAEGHDAPAIASALISLLERPAARSDIARRSRERAATLPSWAESSSVIADTYRRAAACDAPFSRRRRLRRTP